MIQNRSINKNRDYINTILSVIPDKQGVYQYFNNSGDVIYVGKAKNLKKRVSSYFAKKHTHRKTALLVHHIADIKYMVVDTEEDALLLENNLIKKYRPRYNIRLKDDKTYPWICIKKERYPRVFKTRKVVQDGSRYFGPYTSYRTVNTLLGMFCSLYKLRTCNYNLTEENTRKGKYKLCLEYHIGNCRGPCQNLISVEKYNESIEEIAHILKGNITGVIRHMKQRMEDFAANYQYEEAQQMKEKIGLLEKYQSRSAVVSPEIRNVDVFSIVADEQYAVVNYLKVLNGAIIQIHTMEIQKKLEEKTEDILLLAIVDIRQRLYSNAKEIIVPFNVHTRLEGITFHVPSRGDKKHLLDLSIRNAKYYRLEAEKHKATARKKKRTGRILEQMKKDLQLKQLPEHIECFDNSNLQGSNPVASCVVFKNAVPAKKEYRHFEIKTVKGTDDFASMQEVVYRRYKRLLEEEKPLPQLIVVDGGKGQLSSAVKALEKLNLRGKTAIIGIAKKLEELYFPGDEIPLYIDKTSETLKIIQQLRNEAHRFGINFHRNKRSKNMFVSELDAIPGIGPKTIQKLLTEFRSVNKIREVSYDDLSASIGRAKASKIVQYFAEKKPEG